MFHSFGTTLGGTSVLRPAFFCCFRRFYGRLFSGEVERGGRGGGGRGVGWDTTSESTDGLNTRDGGPKPRATWSPLDAGFLLMPTPRRVDKLGQCRPHAPQTPSGTKHGPSRINSTHTRRRSHCVSCCSSSFFFRVISLCFLLWPLSSVYRGVRSRVIVDALINLQNRRESPVKLSKSLAIFSERTIQPTTQWFFFYFFIKPLQIRSN